MNKQVRILVVEDVKEMRRLFVEWLLTVPFFITEEARTLAEAKAVLARGGIDAVLLDLGLPDASGMEALMALKEIRPETPVVVVTGVVPEAEEMALAHGARDFIVKPPQSPEDVIDAVRKAVIRQEVEERFAPLRESRVSTEAAIERFERETGKEGEP